MKLMATNRKATTPMKEKANVILIIPSIVAVSRTMVSCFDLRKYLHIALNPIEPCVLKTGTCKQALDKQNSYL